MDREARFNSEYVTGKRYLSLPFCPAICVRRWFDAFSWVICIWIGHCIRRQCFDRRCDFCCASVRRIFGFRKTFSDGQRLFGVRTAFCSWKWIYGVCEAECSRWRIDLRCSKHFDQLAIWSTFYY